eukprot:scaffold20591_cov132-Isochrysis_galbana.AAC.2
MGLNKAKGPGAAVMCVCVFASRACCRCARAYVRARRRRRPVWVVMCVWAHVGAGAGASVEQRGVMCAVRELYIRQCKNLHVCGHTTTSRSWLVLVGGRRLCDCGCANMAKERQRASNVTPACVARAATQAAQDRCCTLAPKYDAKSPSIT